MSSSDTGGPALKASRFGPLVASRQSDQLPRKTETLPHVQALRAIAVLVVVTFHLWPNELTGGFVGVDVFFGISGFLITSHLVREFESHGTIRLLNFWARRIRRLLPAAFFVLGVSLMGTILFAPSTVWHQVIRAIQASALYFANWQLAADSVDYFAAENIATPVQHYWSLSAEEQFYLVWPVLLLGVIVACRRSVQFRRLAIVVITLVTVASLTYSVLISISSQSEGYFSTFSHVWEFGLGGLLAMIMRRPMKLAPAASALASWLGFAMIVLAAFTFSGDTLFPGYAALLPLAGTMLVIAAGRSSAAWSPTRLVDWAPVQYTGNISYSLYLWHWPLIVLLPFVTGHNLTTTEKVVVLLASFACAGATKVLIEDRFRSARWLTSSKGRTYGAAAVTTALLLGVCWWPGALVDRAVAREQQQAAAAVAAAQAANGADSCFGAAAGLDEGRCPDSHVLQPGFGPDASAVDTPDVWLQNNVAPQFVDTKACPYASPAVKECRFSDDPATFTVAVVGDSHARVLVTPLLIAAKSRGWRVLLVWSGDCRAALPIVPSPRENENGLGCGRWKTNVTESLAKRPDIDVIVTTGWTKQYARAGSPELSEQLAKNFTGTWDRWAAGGRQVLVVRDVPEHPSGSVSDCVAQSHTTNDPCALPRSEADPIDPVDLALAANRDPSIHSLDLSPNFCDALTCHFVVGGVITTRDSQHLTVTFANTLAPQIAEAIERVGG